MPKPLLAVALILLATLSGCSLSPPRDSGTGLSGHLILIGGGLDDDNKPVYERFIALASQGQSPPQILIATAASGDEHSAARGKTESIRAYCPTAEIDVIRRETPADQTIALIDRASAMFFTGGDQKRITDRYRPGGIDTAEAVAMRRLLSRGGLIAGTSAGDAMMSDPMFLTGRSAEALGIRSTRTSKADDDDPDDKAKQPVFGPRIGPGMGFLPWAIADSHFFERHRFGRLVAACEASGRRLGLGIAEDAAVEIDLATGEATGLSAADSLLIDVAAMRRDGLARRGIYALIISQGTRISFTSGVLASSLPTQPACPATPPREISTSEPGSDRRSASWRFFTRAQAPGAAPQLLKLDGYDQCAWPTGGGWSNVDITPQPR